MNTKIKINANRRLNEMLFIPLLFVPLICVPGAAQATGFQLQEHSATGLGRAFSGDAVIGDNAAALSRNPAIMTLFENSQISVAASYIDPNVNISGDTTHPITPDTPIAVDEKDIAPAGTVPGLYYIQALSDKWKAGLAVFSNFSLPTDYGDDFSASDLANYTEISTITINPNVAYRINKQWSLGAGIDITYGEAKLKTTGSYVPFKGITLFEMDGDGTAYSWNAGVLYELSAQTRFGLSYRSEVEIEFKGKGSIAGQPQQGSVTVNLPTITEFSAYHELNDEWAIHSSIMNTGWSTTDTLAAKVDGMGDVHLKDQYFDNALRIAVGTTYQYSEQWTLRTGYAFDNAATSDEYRTLSIPESDKHQYSMGATYRISENLSVDGGYAYNWGEVASIEEKDPNTGTIFKGEVEGAGHIASLQFNMGF